MHPTSIDVGDVTTWQIATLSMGVTYYFVVQAYDSSGLTSDPSAEAVFTDPTATPPTMAQPANQTSTENSSVSLQLVGSDPDGDTLTYSATGLPASLSLNTATGLISGTLPFGSAGTYTVAAPCPMARKPAARASRGRSPVRARRPPSRCHNMQISMAGRRPPRRWRSARPIRREISLPSQSAPDCRTRRSP